MALAWIQDMETKKKVRRMTDEQKAEATRRALAGESPTTLGAEYGVTRSYISLLLSNAKHPERYKRLVENKRKRKLTEAEAAALRDTMEGSNPAELGLEPPIIQWRDVHVFDLAQRMFGKRLFQNTVDQCLEWVAEPASGRKPDILHRRPTPPVRLHPSELDPELAADPAFVKFYYSPEAEQLAWREYEFALADWQSRHGDAEVVGLEPETSTEGAEKELSEDDPTPRQLPQPQTPPGRRRGKHAGSKPHPTSRSKKKRRKKRR